MWCHLLLAMPLLGLGLFVFLPWQVALPLYLIVDALSILLYSRIRHSMHQPVRSGREAMIGQTVTVTAVVATQDWQVRYHNELWGAVSDRVLSMGEQARIVAIRGMKLVVQPVSDRAQV
jgi:membrane protein implicated in regulation of membrane protease activity